MTHHPAHVSDTQERVTFGFFVYLMSDCVLFAALFACYAVLGGQVYGHADSKAVVDLPYVLAETLILLTSSFTVGLALVASRYGRRGATFAALMVTFALGASFVGLEAREFMGLVAAGNGPQASAFLSSFFALLGTHGLHVTLGLVWMLVAMAHVAVRGFGPGTAPKLACLALFWHFLDIIWIFIFTFVYLFGLV